MPEIKCIYCKKTYSAFREKRSHCSRPECRGHAIDHALDQLREYVGIFLRHRIEAEIEIRCPGNDGFGKQARSSTKGHLGDLETKQDCDPSPQTDLDMLSTYFSPILWKGIKGNFIIRTLDTGKVDQVILNDTFSDLKDPVVLGNNLLLSHRNISMVVDAKLTNVVRR